MNNKYMYPLIAVMVVILLAYVGVEAAGLQVLFGIILPYIAVLIFIAGFVYRVMDWASSPVPFSIPSTCGQQKTLSWIKHDKIDNPTTTIGVIIRMMLEILLFRSLFRNTKFALNEGPKISYVWEKWLWLVSLAFHYSFLVVLIRHLRFFLEPVPVWLQWLEDIDTFLQLGLPGLFLSGAILLGATTFLFLRRIYLPEMRYISLAADYFPLFLIISIAITGILMRYFTKVYIVGIKELTIGLASFHPTIPEGIGALFYIHLLLVSVFFAYFPFSKLMHMPGIFLSPTRNLANNTRFKRYINPWNYPVETHTYEEYEDEFRERMIEAGLPVVKGLPVEKE